jgi:transposase
MNKQIEPPPEYGIRPEDWEQTPSRVRVAFMVLYQQVEQLKEQMAELREQVNRNSRNSSQPPSSDGPEKQKHKKKTKSRKKQGGQKGHQGHRRKLVSIEDVDEIVVHKPEKCAGCGALLEGEDPEPYRHQVTELPPVKPHVTEHQVHKVICPCCEKENGGELPPEVAVSQFGPNLVALVVLLMGVYRLSKRQVKSLLEDCFSIDMSASSVVNQQKAVSKALEKPVTKAYTYVKTQAVKNVDETGWYQHDQEKKGWLWVVVTPMVTVFKVAKSRAGKIAKELLGEDNRGIVGSDRYSAYNWLMSKLRQVCWAHLLRDFQKILERGGVSSVVGEYLCQEGEDLLALWARVRDGLFPYADFLMKLPSIQKHIRLWLTVGAVCSHAKTSRTCRRILKIETALWTFTIHPGVEPTNNSAERALRKAVIWRRISYGTQSDAGSRFVERILTVVETCRQQNRNPLEYLQHTVAAHRTGQPVPSLLPNDQAVVFLTP